MKWFDKVLNLENLPSFQYNVPLENEEQNKALWQLYIHQTKITTKDPLSQKMTFMNFTHDGFIQRSR